jgi:hypothetical protein
VKPAVGIHPYGLASEFLKITWLLNRFKQREQACKLLSRSQWPDPGLFSPWMPIVPRTERVSLQNGFVYSMNRLPERQGDQLERDTLQKLYRRVNRASY